MQTQCRRQNSTAGRIGRLSVLPVFFRIEGRPVLVIGGSEGAAWKAELLAAAGAKVMVICPGAQVSAEMRDVLALCRNVLHFDVHWRRHAFEGAAMVVGDVPEEEAGSFAEKAHRAGVPVNVVDRPAFCDFQFGSIVNRSPIVIGISTAGAAPILGQAVRRRIEAVLPDGLKAWAELARRIRSTVMDMLASPADRRRFWEAFVARAFGGGVPEFASWDLSEIVGRLASGKRPSANVSVIGVDLADAELMTLRTIRLLQSADLILHHKTIGPAFLEFARREAQRQALPERFDIEDLLARAETLGGNVCVLLPESREAEQGVPLRPPPRLLEKT